MVNVQNISTIKELRKAAQLSNSEAVPTRLAESIVPVIDINPDDSRKSTLLGLLNDRATTGTSINLLIAGFPASATSKMFITKIHVTNTQDATSDNTSMFIAAIINGISRRIFSRKKTTTTASTTLDLISFPRPLELDLNSPLTFDLAFTVGASSTDVQVFGYVLNISES